MSSKIAREGLTSNGTSADQPEQHKRLLVIGFGELDPDLAATIQPTNSPRACWRDSSPVSTTRHVQGARLNHTIFAWEEGLLLYETALRYDAVSRKLQAGGASWPLQCSRFIPWPIYRWSWESYDAWKSPPWSTASSRPIPAHVLSCGRGVEALVLAILDGDHALYKVGKRLEERGMVTLLQPGITRASLMIIG